MANTTWNPSDKSASISLTGSNLIATSGASGTLGVRAIGAQITGKFYWEYTFTSTTGTNTGVGVASPASVLANGFTLSSAPLTAGIVRAGGVYIDSANQGLVFGTLTNGTVICIAYDCNAKLIWFRAGAAGNWNTVGTANPATGTGGISTDLGGAIPVYPYAAFTASGDQITANFGDTTFTGTVPSGFTAGFTAGATINTNALATQIAAEHWLTTNPNAQVTQVALEHWATVASVPEQALVTQVAIEHWASVAAFAGGPIITMIG